MEISGINHAVPFTFTLPEKDDSGSTPAAVLDTVQLSTPELLTDEQAESVLDETMMMIGDDPLAALSVHSGLNENRVFALLGL